MKFIELFSTELPSQTRCYSGATTCRNFNASQYNISEDHHPHRKTTTSPGGGTGGVSSSSCVAKLATEQHSVEVWYTQYYDSDGYFSISQSRLPRVVSDGGGGGINKKDVASGNDAVCVAHCWSHDDSSDRRRRRRRRRQRRQRGTNDDDDDDDDDDDKHYATHLRQTMEVFCLLPPPSRNVGIRSSSSSQRSNKPSSSEQKQQQQQQQQQTIILTEQQQQQQPSVVSSSSQTIPLQPHDESTTTPSSSSLSPPVVSYLVIRGDVTTTTPTTTSQQQQQQQIITPPPPYQYIPLSFHPLSLAITSLFIDDIPHTIIIVISATDGIIHVFLSYPSLGHYFREVSFSNAVPLRLGGVSCRTVRVISSDNEDVCRLLVGGEDGSVFFLRLRLRYERAEGGEGGVVAKCDVEGEPEVFLVDGVIACADVMMFDERRWKWGGRCDDKMMMMKRSLRVPRRLVVVGSLDGFACLFEQLGDDDDSKAIEGFEGPLPVIEGLWTNAHRHSEDAVLAVHCFEFGTRAGYAIAVGTYSGRFIICEPIISRSEVTTTRGGCDDGGKSDDKKEDNDVVGDTDGMEEDDDKIVGKDEDMVTLDSTFTSLSDGNNDNDGDGGRKTDETAKDDNKITEDTNETDDDNTKRLDSTTLASLPEGDDEDNNDDDDDDDKNDVTNNDDCEITRETDDNVTLESAHASSLLFDGNIDGDRKRNSADEGNDDDKNDETTNAESEIMGESGGSVSLESTPASLLSDVKSDGDAKSSNSDGDEGNENGDCDADSDSDGDGDGNAAADSKGDTYGDGDGDVNSDGNGNTNSKDDGDGEAKGNGGEDDDNNICNGNGDEDGDRDNDVDDTNGGKECNTNDTEYGDDDSTTYSNDKCQYRRLWHCRLPYPIHAISSADLNGDGIPELLVTTRKSLHVFGANVSDLADVAKERFQDLLFVGMMSSSSCGSVDG